MFKNHIRFSKLIVKQRVFKITVSDTLNFEILKFYTFAANFDLKLKNSLIDMKFGMKAN